MGIISRLGGFRPSPLTGQPQSGGMLTQPGVSPIAATFARNVGGLLGRDMRTPAEKLAEAQQGMDLGTYEGQLAAAQARLKFETDPVKQQEIGQQIINLRNSQAQANRDKASAESAAKKIEQLEVLNAKAEPLFRQAGYTELADLAKGGHLTKSEITSNLTNIRKDELSLERNQGDLTQAVLNTPELEGTEAHALAKKGELPVIAPRFQLPYIAALREEAEQDQFITTLKLRKGGNDIVKDLEDGIISFTEAQKQASDLGDVSYGDIKFYKVGNEILPTRERKQQDGTKDVVTWSPLQNKYVEIDETSLEKVPPEKQPKTPRVVSPPSKAENVQVINAFEYPENAEEQPGKPSNKEKLNELNRKTRKRVLIEIADRASQLKAQNPGTPFSQHIQPAIDEVMNRVKFTRGLYNDEAEFTPATVVKEWTAD